WLLPLKSPVSPSENPQGHRSRPCSLQSSSKPSAKTERSRADQPASGGADKAASPGIAPAPPLRVCLAGVTAGVGGRQGRVLSEAWSSWRHVYNIPASDICRLDLEQPPSRTDRVLGAQFRSPPWPGLPAGCSMGCARGQASLGIRGPEKGRGLPGPPGVGLDPDPLPLTLVPSCQDDQWALHSHGPQSRAQTVKTEPQGVEGGGAHMWTLVGMHTGHHIGPPGTQGALGRPTLDAPTQMLMACSVPGALVSLGLAFLLSLTAHCSHPQAEGATQGGLDVSRANLWASANTSLLQGFWCQLASQLSRDQLATLIRRMETQHVLLGAWQVKEADCQAFVCRATQGNTGLLANLPDQRATLRHRALACLGGPRPSLSTSDLLLLGVLVCDMDASSIMAADPHSLPITELLSVGRKEGTGRPFIRGDITAAMLHDDLFLVRYDCVQLESCLGSLVLRANLDPLLQHPLPAQCQQVVKAKLAQVRQRLAVGGGLAGALDITSCPQSRKNVLCDKAREAFGSARTAHAYYSFTHPHLGETSLSVGNVTTLLGQNVGDLQKAHSHPTISSWLRSLNQSALGELGLDTDPTGPTGLTHSTTGTPNTTPWTPHLVPTSDWPWSTDPSSALPQHHLQENRGW
ncbi:hypothetical protein E2I00_007267, partial [Balaenoptera physalus]